MMALLDSSIMSNERKNMGLEKTKASPTAFCGSDNIGASARMIPNPF
jgi:hypothetical protein